MLVIETFYHDFIITTLSCGLGRGFRCQQEGLKLYQWYARFLDCFLDTFFTSTIAIERSLEQGIILVVSLIEHVLSTVRHVAGSVHVT